MKVFQLLATHFLGPMLDTCLCHIHVPTELGIVQLDIDNKDCCHICFAQLTCIGGDLLSVVINNYVQ